MITFEKYFNKFKKKRKKKTRISTENLPIPSHSYTGDKNYVNTPPYGNPPNTGVTISGSYQ